MLINRLPPKSTLFPYTTLFRSSARPVGPLGSERALTHPPLAVRCVLGVKSDSQLVIEASHAFYDFCAHAANFLDRKSTRLNSSHPSISYAVFCLKKKNKYIVTLLSYLIIFLC